MKILLIITTSVSTVLMADYRTQHQTYTPFNMNQCVMEMPVVPCLEGDDEDPEPMVSGIVTDNSVFKNPFYHACVQLKTSNGTLIATTGTNAQGHYYFNSVTNGAYVIVVTVTGYAPQSVPITINGTPLKNINVTIR